LDLLKPHLSQALTTSKLFSYYSEAAEDNGQAWIVVDSAGRIVFETGKAIGLLKEYFGHNYRHKFEIGLGVASRDRWITFWLRNPSEIAEILGARSRTIGKHVERILGKLRVETRTAAANIAGEFLHFR
jgi:hypothetical protein